MRSSPWSSCSSACRRRTWPTMSWRLQCAWRSQVHLVVMALSLFSVSTLCEGRRFMERTTNFGRVRGLVETVQGGKRVEKYLGIPYARPPLGKLRFEAPVAPKHWEGVLRATELPPACPQPRMGVTYIDMHVPGFNRTSEDCLYLNIHTPKHGTHNRNSYPVIVFVHGGSYENGMGAMLDGDTLATYDVIVITFNYRLGALGFLSAPNSPLKGNYGMLDQIEALKWVKGNIAHFGGDPDRITIDGHSAGGCSVGLLMLSPLARGLFTGVIEQSGSPFAHWAVSRHQSVPTLYFKMFVTAMGCSGNYTSSQMKQCLQDLPTEIVQEVILNEPELSISLIPPFRPGVDGYFLPDLPEVLAARGEVTGHHMLTGATRDEGLMAAIPLVKRYDLKNLEGTQKLLVLMNCFRGDLPQVHGIVESILEAYAQWPYNMNEEEIKNHFSEIVGDYFIVAPTHKTASVMTALNLTVFVYNYEYRSDYDQWEGVIHGSELFYLSGFPLKGHSNFRYDESDKRMAHFLLQLWSNFVKNGLPSLVPLQNFHMPRFTLEQHAYTRVFSADRAPTLSVQHDLKPAKLAFWNQGVPEMYQRQLAELAQYPPPGTIFAPRHSTRGPTSTEEEGYGVEEEEGEEGGRSVDGTPGRNRTDSNSHNKLQPNDNKNVGGRFNNPGPYITAHEPNHWFLVAACIGLSFLTVLLSVCYCQVRRQVTNLMRQSSVSSGQPML